MIHLILFNIYSVFFTVQEVVFYGYIYGWFDMTHWQAGMTVDSFRVAGDLSYFLLNMFIAYLLLQYGNPEDRSQDMLFRFLMGQALKTNPKKTPPQELLLIVYARMSLASEIRQTQQVVGPLIKSFEGISYDSMESLTLLDREIVVDETGFSNNSFDDNKLDWDRLRDCNDSYEEIWTKRLM